MCNCTKTTTTPIHDLKPGDKVTFEVESIRHAALNGSIYINFKGSADGYRGTNVIDPKTIQHVERVPEPLKAGDRAMKKAIISGSHIPGTIKCVLDDTFMVIHFDGYSAPEVRRISNYDRIY